MTKIKICGITRPEEIEMVNMLEPDYIGFVFADSKRRVPEEKAAGLKSLLKKNIRTVGVFVNENPEKIINLCRMGVIDLVQLHGDEDFSYIKNLSKEISNKIIKAVRVRSRAQVLEAAGFPCDYLLLDSYSKNTYGGSGKSFDWDIIPDINKPFFLAGGLNHQNVAKAIEKCRPFGVDTSSGVERDGVKNYSLMKDFILAARKGIF